MWRVSAEDGIAKSLADLCGEPHIVIQVRKAGCQREHAVFGISRCAQLTGPLNIRVKHTAKSLILAGKRAPCLGDNLGQRCVAREFDGSIKRCQQCRRPGALQSN